MRLNLSFGGLLTLLFAVAKLAGLVAWSWWVVFTPVIISFFVGLLVLFSLLTVAVIAAIAADKVK